MKKLILCSLAAVLLVYPAVRRPAPASTQPLVTEGDGISIVTLNMAQRTDAGEIVRELRANPALREADVFLLQEVKQDRGQPQCVAEQLASTLGLHVAYSPAETGITDQGLAILSRFELKNVQKHALKHYDLRFRSRNRFVLTATAATLWGPVRISNTHLDTRVNPQERLAQLETVLAEGEDFAGPRIVGGDFNSNGFYCVGHLLPTPALRSQAEVVRDFMQRHGFRTAGKSNESTFDFPGMRLDWIWLQGLEPSDSRVFPLDFTDHHAVWTRIKLGA